MSVSVRLRLTRSASNGSSPLTRSGAIPPKAILTKAPDITTNSWTCPSSEGCSPTTLQAGVEAQRAAGIMMVVAAGNSGPSCSTVSDPPALYDAVYTVGALNTNTDTLLLQ